MTPYGKTAQTAIAAVSRLAEVFSFEPPVKLSSADIAAKRNLPQPVVAKVLTILSQAGIVRGSPGPGGGYSLTRPPREISLLDVVLLFERLEDNVSCPFGPHYCGTSPQCPLHYDLLRVRDQMIAFLRTSTFDRFVDGAPRNDAPYPTRRELATVPVTK